MLFDVGNLITLGIVFLVLLLFRLMDRSNRSLEKFRKYVERCKEDITIFIGEQASLIKDYGINLDVERKAAMELMRRIQTLTREELAQKVETLNDIDDRMRMYDTSLEELVQMTARVQENLNRIRDESAFVDTVGKRIGDVKDKVENIDTEIVTIGKKLETIELRFERENSEALDRAIEETVSTAKSTLADFEAGAGVIERKLEDHREAIDRMERNREELIAHNEEQLEKVLMEAVAKAGARADKAEESALAKLRDQAQERLNGMKANFEEKIKTVQDTVKIKLIEIQDQLKGNSEAWKAETSAIEERQKNYSAEWKKDTGELNSLAQELRENMESMARENGQRLIEAAQETIRAKLNELQELLDRSREEWQTESAAIQRQNAELSGEIRRQREDWEAVANETGQKIVDAAQDTVRAKFNELQDLYASSRDEWQSDSAAIEARQNAYTETWKKDVEELNSLAYQQQEKWNRDIEEFTALARQQAESLSAAIHQQGDELGGEIRRQREDWEAVARETGQKIVDAAQDTIREKLGELQEQYAAGSEAWKTENAAIEARQNAYTESWKKDVEELNSLARQQQEKWNRDMEEFAALARQQTESLSAAIHRQGDELGGAIRQQREDWEAVAHAEWKAEAEAIESRQKSYSAEWKQNIEELNSLARQQQEKWNRDIEEFTALAKQQAGSLNSAIQQQNEDFSGIIAKQREEWEAMYRETGQDIVAAAHDRLDEYRQAQDEQFRQLSAIANDTAKLEAELRHAMQESMNLVNSDFAAFGQEIRGNWESSSAELNRQMQALRTELSALDHDLSGIKEKAFDNVSQKLKGFEDEFLSDLSRRGSEIDNQLAAWQEALDKRLEAITADSEAKRQTAEAKLAEDTKKTITAQGEKLVSDLERLKAETAAFEEGIREEMRGADESRRSFNEQLERDLEEAKNAAENELNTKIGQYNLSVADTIRQSQRDLETQIRNLAADTKDRISAMESSADNFRKTIEEWQNQHSTRMRELDESMEEARRRSRELAAESDERISTARASVDEMRREVAAQAKLFDRTDALKEELNRHVQDMSGDIDRLTQLKNDITHLENQLNQIKRLENDVNAKMTHFLSEKRRIEVMENDFNRLLQTSQSVEERLAQVSNSDDVLQTIQVQLRRLDDVIRETEEKYNRIERKSKALQETNDGIDRNFRALQESEQSIKRMGDTVEALQSGMDTIEDSVRTLSTENAKARDAAEKLSTLDETVKWLEKRISEMNVARESLARLATEMQNLDKDAQAQLGITRSLLSRVEGSNAGRSGKTADDGAPPQRDRENIIRLRRQGWSVEEIASTMKLSRGEVELILEMGPKD